MSVQVYYSLSEGSEETDYQVGLTMNAYAHDIIILQCTTVEESKQNLPVLTELII